MHYLFHYRPLRLAAAGASVCAAFAFLGSAAHASNLATCTFKTHVTLSNGTFSSQGSGDADCTGVIDGVLPAPGGAFAAQGTYGASSCSSGSWRGTFEAEIPRELALFASQDTRVLGTVQITQTGHMLMASGSGTIDGRTIGYGGTGSFVPDSGQSCSGTLTENVVIMDTGGESAASQASSASAGGNHHHHRRHHRRHPGAK